MSMAFPIDAKYFPLIFDGGLSDIAGQQNYHFKVLQDKLRVYQG